MSWIAGLEAQLKAALGEQKLQIFLGLIERELPELTFGQLAELLQSPLGAILRDVKVHRLVRPPHPLPLGGRPPKSTNPAQVRREEAMLKLLQASDVPLSNAEVAERLGDPRGVYHGLRRLVERGLAIETGPPFLLRYAAVRPEAPAPSADAPAPRASDGESVEAKILDQLLGAPDGLAPATLRATLGVDVSEALQSLKRRHMIAQRGAGKATRYVLGVVAIDRLRQPDMNAIVRSTAEAIVKLLRREKDPLRVQHIRQKTGRPMKHVRLALEHLLETGVVRKIDSRPLSTYALARR